jgi:hypothetical protein
MKFIYAAVSSSARSPLNGASCLLCDEEEEIKGAIDKSVQFLNLLAFNLMLLREGNGFV